MSNALDKDTKVFLERVARDMSAQGLAPTPENIEAAMVARIQRDREIAAMDGVTEHVIRRLWKACQ